MEDKQKYVTEKVSSLESIMYPRGRKGGRVCFGKVIWVGDMVRSLEAIETGDEVYLTFQHDKLAIRYHWLGEKYTCKNCNGFDKENFCRDYSPIEIAGLEEIETFSILMSKLKRMKDSELRLLLKYIPVLASFGMLGKG